jgi:hypothetical protein
VKKQARISEKLALEHTFSSYGKVSNASSNNERMMRSDDKKALDKAPN